MCDDLEQTVADLTARGVEFTGPLWYPSVHPTFPSGTRRRRLVSFKHEKPMWSLNCKTRQPRKLG
jgi:hypothetical protein